MLIVSLRCHSQTDYYCKIRKPRLVIHLSVLLCCHLQSPSLGASGINTIVYLIGLFLQTPRAKLNILLALLSGMHRMMARHGWQKSPSEFANIYKDGLVGGHVIMLGGDPASCYAALEALLFLPHHLFRSIILFFCHYFFFALAVYLGYFFLWSLGILVVFWLFLLAVFPFQYMGEITSSHI